LRACCSRIVFRLDFAEEQQPKTGKSCATHNLKKKKKGTDVFNLGRAKNSGRHPLHRSPEDGRVLLEASATIKRKKKFWANKPQPIPRLTD
jgi:hypothetical protein